MSLTKYAYHLLVVIVCLAFSVAPALAAETEVSYEQYEAQLAEYQGRLSSAEGELTALQQSTDAAQSQIRELEAQIAATWKEIYALIGTDEAGVKAFVAQLDGIEAEIGRLRALSPDDLYKRRSEIDAVEARLGTQRASKISALPDVAARIARIQGMIEGLRGMLPKAVLPDQYTVVRGDNLWGISKKETVYNDPNMWPRIYRANTDQIKDPDLIYPNQVLVIPRGAGLGYHVVVEGEWLAKIAGYPDIYGDARQWTRIYEANTDQIKDPDLIYPAQRLLIPGK